MINVSSSSTQKLIVDNPTSNLEQNYTEENDERTCGVVIKTEV
jgi:hypothetical protein